MRFSEVTDDNHAGIIWIISLLCLIYTVLTFGTRAFIKWHMLGPDDYVLVAAQIFAFGQYATIFCSLHWGLGRKKYYVDGALAKHGVQGICLSHRELIVLSTQTALIAQLLLIISLGLAKCSVIFLIRRLFTRDWKLFWSICNGLLALSCVWAVASAIVVSAGCDAEKYISASSGNETCAGFNARWYFVIILDVIIEFFVVVIPVYFLWTLKMAVALKARVVLAFAFRMPVMIFAIIFLCTFTNYSRDSVSVVIPLIWQQLELGYSLVSATIPCLKSFIESFDTGFGHAGETSGNGSYGRYAVGSRQFSSVSNQSVKPFHEPQKPYPHIQVPPGSHKLSSLRPHGSGKACWDDRVQDARMRKKSHPSVGRLRPEMADNRVEIYAGENNWDELERPGSRMSARTSPSASQRSIFHHSDRVIRRDVHVEVVSEVVRSLQEEDAWAGP